jgi:hypothetical protein
MALGYLPLLNAHQRLLVASRARSRRYARAITRERDRSSRMVWMQIFPFTPGGAELVDIHLPEGIDMSLLEPLERFGLLDDPNHEPMLPQEAVDGA